MIEDGYYWVTFGDGEPFPAMLDTCCSDQEWYFFGCEDIGHIDKFKIVSKIEYK